MNSFMPLGMNTPESDILALGDLVRMAKREGEQKTFVVEVGSWAGKTAIAMEEAGSLVWCVDTWRGSVGDTVDDTERMCKDAGGGDNVFRVFCRNVGHRLFRSVFPCRGESTLWADCFPWLVDLVFIDADHRYEAVKSDIEAWLPKVRPGGIICGHDLGVFEGVGKAVDEVLGPVNVSGLCVWWKQV